MFLNFAIFFQMFTISMSYHFYKQNNELQIEMQIKTSMKYYFISTRVAIIKKNDNTNVHNSIIQSS